MAKWSVYRWGPDPRQQDGKKAYEGEDAKRARAVFDNLARDLKPGAAVRLYCDGRCVDDLAPFRRPA